LVPADELERYKHMFTNGPLVGTPERIVERLREIEQLGLTYAIANFADAAYDRSSMDLFAEAVIPEFA
jgi:alkanesulfonate monooxygenase SsuD/methylene tetrahydromethanopterin reductase-like flavin-dependent oxidoreductase (luciferase family)